MKICITKTASVTYQRVVCKLPKTLTGKHHPARTSHLRLNLKKSLDPVFTAPNNKNHPILQQIYTIYIN